MEVLDYYDGMEIPATCIIRGMPNDAYHSCKSISKSGLDLFDRSPAHLHFAEPFKSSRAMVIGTAIHTALLEPERFEKEYLLLESVTDRRSAVYKDAIKHTPEENVLVSTEAKNVKSMVETAQANADFQEYARQGYDVELSFFGICSETGVPVRCRFDMITHDGRALDLKKTRDARYDDFSRSIMNYRYHVQHAFYSHVYECVTGQQLKSFAFFAVEENSPHTNAIYQLCDESVSIGKQLMLENLNAYASCENPSDSIWTPKTIISLPVWYLNQFAQDSITMSEE